jgi:Ca2+/H+ antiporter, TMEM165/GDT1 family
MNDWLAAGTTFLASSVEFVEAATIVLAVGYAQGWRAAIGGSVCAAVALGAIVALFGPALANAASLHRIELVVGPFMVLFGIAWLRKAVWRFAGLKALHDEQAIYDREVARLQASSERRAGFAAAFQGVFVEGLEVAVIVVTFAAARNGALAWSVGGALAAFAIVTIAAVALRKPFARVPENAMKALVGLMLVALGTYWTGEGVGIAWWFGDATLFAIAGAYAVAATAASVAMRAKAAA